MRSKKQQNGEEWWFKALGRGESESFEAPPVRIGRAAVELSARSLDDDDEHDGESCYSYEESIAVMEKSKQMMKHSHKQIHTKSIADDDMDTFDARTDANVGVEDEKKWREIFEDDHPGCMNLLVSGLQKRIESQDIVVKIMAFTSLPESKTFEFPCEQVPLPDMPAFMCVGHVMSEAARYPDLKINDRVLGLLGKKFTFELYGKLPASCLVKIPDSVDPWSQLALAITYLPALQALQTASPSLKGKNILINGGAGPVCQALITLSRIHGANNIYVPTNKKHRDLVRSLGAKTLGPSHVNWGISMMNSMDIVIDGIGENSYVTSKAALKSTGYLVCIGGLAMSPEISLHKLWADYRLNSSSRAEKYGLMSRFDTDCQSIGHDFEYLNSLLLKGEITPIANRVSLSQYKLSIPISLSSGVPICDPWLKD